MAKRDELSLVISDVVVEEIDQTSNAIRRKKLRAIANAFHTVLPLSAENADRGVELQQRGFKAFDALHIAIAEAAGVDRLCTGDDRLRRKCRNQTDIRVTVVSPIELLQEFQK